MNRFCKVLIIYFVFIITVNGLFWALVGLSFGPIEDLYDDGLVIKLKPLGRAYVFAHGSYHYEYVYSKNFDLSLPISDSESIVYHGMTLKDSQISTYHYVVDLHNQGYEYVWGTWCNTGNDKYIYKHNDTLIPWPDYVSRKTRPGKTTPVFWGLGFIRI